MTDMPANSTTFRMSEFVRTCLSDEDAQKIEKFGDKFHKLVTGEIEPSSEAQKRFISVFTGTNYPFTDWEFLWLRFNALNEIEKQLPSVSSQIGTVEFLADLAEHLAKKNKNDRSKLATYLAQVSAQKGNAQAFYLLGVMHEYGIGTVQNPAEARGYYKEARDLGVPVEDYKIYLPDLGTAPIAGTGCKRTVPQENNLVPSREIDDYDASDWESPY